MVGTQINFHENPSSARASSSIMSGTHGGSNVSSKDRSWSGSKFGKPYSASRTILSNTAASGQPGVVKVIITCTFSRPSTFDTETSYTKPNFTMFMPNSGSITFSKC